ncbi:condensation domain-containing protein [Actinoplanes oblitus]|uniref:Condensation domain-containing protein n=1 Tax=Actinoplanes oblitus TaxID=3040509 RepID=A0ABY8WSQ4_9ACTN|nr:condensation domain-containing protein [Actinoplanes oblitus]WIN00885.1 condensation domain-containing protein [Actinoplanes oblitus]
MPVELSARQLALLQRLRAGGGATTSTSTIPHSASAAPVLSSAQERIWFSEQLWPGTAVQNLAAAITLTGPLDVAALRAALARIVARHEPLRTRYRPAPELFAGPELIEAGAEAEVGTLAREPIDLSHGPLRLRLLRRAADRHVLLIVCHHIAFDGWSLGVLVAELSAYYGTAAELPDLPVRYTDFARWQRDRAAAGDFEADLRHWTRELAGEPPPLDFPTGRPRPARLTFRGRIHRFAVDPPVVRRLGELAQRERTPGFSILTAAFAATLGSLTGRRRMTIGSPVANRVRPELESLIGVFINTVCLRVAIEEGDTFRTLLHRAHRTCQAALSRAEAPFELVVRRVNPPRDPSRNPLYSAMLVYQNSPLPPFALPGLTAEVEQLDTGTAKVDLTLYVEDRSGGFRCSLEHNTDLLDETWAARIAGRFQALLAAGVARPDTLVADLMAAHPHPGGD